MCNDKIYLMKPSEKYKSKIIDFREEFLANNEIAYGTEQLYATEIFEEWLMKVQNNERKETVENGRPPLYEYMAIVCVNPNGERDMLPKCCG